MGTLPKPVRRLAKALEGLPGVREVEIGVRAIDGIKLRELSLPGEFGEPAIARVKKAMR